MTETIPNGALPAEPERTLAALAALFEDPRDKGRVHSGRGLSTGAVAELRRIDPSDTVASAAFWGLLVSEVPEAWREHPDQDRAWAVVIQGMALMAPRPHAADKAGRVLADTGYSEMRFVRLLRARNGHLERDVRSACRWFWAKGAAVDWIDFGRFVLARSGARWPRFLDPRAAGDRLAKQYFVISATSSNGGMP